MLSEGFPTGGEKMSPGVTPGARRIGDFQNAKKFKLPESIFYSSQ